MNDSAMRNVGEQLDGIYEELYNRVKPYNVKKDRKFKRLDVAEKVSLIQEIMGDVWGLEVDETATKFENSFLKDELKRKEEELERCRMNNNRASKRSKKDNDFAYKRQIDSGLVADLYKKGLSVSQIADKLKTSRPTVYERLEKMGIYTKKRKDDTESFIDMDEPFK